MHSDAADVITPEFDLAGVDARTKLQPEFSHALTKSTRASHRSRWPIETGEQSVSRGLHQ